MLGPLIFATYLVGLAAFTVLFGRWRHEVDQKDLGVEQAEPHRAFNFWVGFATALFWPVVWPAAIGAELLSGPARRLSRTRLDREHAQAKELERVRAWARANGLPYPEEGQ